MKSSSIEVAENKLSILAKTQLEIEIAKPQKIKEAINSVQANIETLKKQNNESLEKKINSWKKKEYNKEEIEYKKKKFLKKNQIVLNEEIEKLGNLKYQLSLPMKTPKIEYSGKDFVVISGAIIPLDIVALQSQKSIKNDAVKFVIQGNNVHMIQFVTHQYPNFDEANSKQTTANATGWGWDGEIDSYFTTNPKEPKWRVDAASGSKSNTKPSPYYDNHGARESENPLIVYDEPGTTMQEEERAIFVTFLILENEIIQLQWARQEDVQGDLFYQFGPMQSLQQLPDWALLVMRDDIFLTNRIDMGAKLTYEVPEKLNREVDYQTVKDTDSFQKSLETSFLQPPERWVTVNRYPNIFLAFTVEKDNQSQTTKELKEEHRTNDFSETIPTMTQLQSRPPAYELVFQRSAYDQRKWMPDDMRVLVGSIFDKYMGSLLHQLNIKPVMPAPRFQAKASVGGWQLFYLPGTDNGIAVLNCQDQKDAEKIIDAINKKNTHMQAKPGNTRGVPCVIISFSMHTFQDDLEAMSRQSLSSKKSMGFKK